MPRIFIHRTKAEWSAIGNTGAKSGIPSIVLRATSTFVEELKDNPNKVSEIKCKRIKKEFNLPEDHYNELIRLAAKLNTPLATIVDQLIISPLLLNK